MTHVMHRVMPALLCGAGLAYLIFALGLESRIMPGDPGYDPGSRALPILSGVFLTGIALVLLLRDTLSARPPSDLESSQEDMRSGSAAVVHSVLVHLASAVVLLATLTTVGFVVAASAVLAVLLLENRRLAGDSVPVTLWIGLPVMAAIGGLALYAGLEHVALGFRAMAAAQEAPDMLTGRYGGVAFSSIAFAIAAYGLIMLVKRFTRLSPSVCLVPVLVPVAILMMFNQVFLVRLPAFPAAM